MPGPERRLIGEHLPRRLTSCFEQPTETVLRRPLESTTRPDALPTALLQRSGQVSSEHVDQPSPGSSARGAHAQTAPPADQDAASAVLGQPDTPGPGRVDPAQLPDQPERNEAARCLRPD